MTNVSEKMNNGDRAAGKFEKYRLAGKIAFTLAALAALAVYIYRHGEDFVILTKLSPVNILIISVLTIINLVLNASVFMVALRSLGFRLSVPDWLGLAALNRLMNHILIKSGPVFRGVYLKKRYALSYRLFVMLSVFVIIAAVLGAALVGITALLLIAWRFSHVNLWLLGAMICAAGAALAAICFPAVLLPPVAKKIMYELHGQWQSFRRRGLFMPVMAYAIAANLVFAAKLWYLYHIFYGGISFLTAATIGAAGNIASFVTFTPAAIGIREAAMAITAGFTAGNVDQAALVALVDRVSTLAWLPIISVIFIIPWLTHKNRSKEGNEPE